MSYSDPYRTEDRIKMLLGGGTPRDSVQEYLYIILKKMFFSLLIKKERF